LIATRSGIDSPKKTDPRSDIALLNVNAKAQLDSTHDRESQTNKQYRQIVPGFRVLVFDPGAEKKRQERNDERQ